MLRARRSDSLRASSSICRMSLAISCRASSSVCLSSISLACAALRPEMRSSWIIASACDVVELVRDALAVDVAVADGLLAAVLLRAARVDGLLALHHPLLGLGQLLAAFAQLSLDLAANAVDLLLGLEAGLLDDDLRLAARVLEQLLGLALGAGELARGEVAADEVPHRDAHREPNHDIHRCHHSLCPFTGRAARKRPGNAPGLCHARTCTTTDPAVTTPRGQDGCGFAKPPGSLIVDPWLIGSA